MQRPPRRVMRFAVAAVLIAAAALVPLRLMRRTGPVTALFVTREPAMLVIGTELGFWHRVSLASGAPGRTVWGGAWGRLKDLLSPRARAAPASTQALRLAETDTHTFVFAGLRGAAGTDEATLSAVARDGRVAWRVSAQALRCRSVRTAHALLEGATLYLVLTARPAKGIFYNDALDNVYLCINAIDARTGQIRWHSVP